MICCKSYQDIPDDPKYAGPDTEDYFDAAHHLENYNGKCAERHCHTWQVCVWVRGDESQLADNGILWDFNNLKKVISAYDHTDLNEVCDFNPTAENIAKWVHDQIRNCYRVDVQESEGNTATYESE